MKDRRRPFSGLCQQTKIAIACYVVMLLLTCCVPREVAGIQIYASNAAKWRSVAWAAVGSAICAVAVQCSVVGRCDDLVWAYVAFLLATTGGSLLAALAASYFWDTLAPAQRVVDRVSSVGKSVGPMASAAMSALGGGTPCTTP